MTELLASIAGLAISWGWILAGLVFLTAIVLFILMIAGVFDNPNIRL